MVVNDRQVPIVVFNHVGHGFAGIGTGSGQLYRAGHHLAHGNRRRIAATQCHLAENIPLGENACHTPFRVHHRYCADVHAQHGFN